ncbi:single-stranded DNA-binding protein [Faucicola atlantae]|uniref:Single-stranded DNA-binding protein n=1 Tax=Faucicola atlantae TaxID=34059 RepID=A0A1B8QK28_9GAMM|nr:single-stranded DNA-binding protein [Moraxella atlantae]OBX83834.1 hypothetical protein A9306_04430 [Moraxella atlantae]
MRGVNKVIIVGNLGNDPDVKRFDNGGMITNISVATSEKWNDRQTGEPREATEWHRIVFNNKLAEIAAQYLRKGSQVYVEGSLRTRKYQDQNGQDRYITEIRADQMQMLGGRPSGQGDNMGYGNDSFGSQNQGYQAQGGYQNQSSYNNQNYQNQGYQNQGYNNPSGGNQFNNPASNQSAPYQNQQGNGFGNPQFQQQPTQAAQSGLPHNPADQAANASGNANDASNHANNQVPPSSAVDDDIPF